MPEHTHKPAKPRRGRARRNLSGFRAPVAFAKRDDARHTIVGNPNTGKRHLQGFDRDSATAKRDGIATQGAREARKAPLGNRTILRGSERIPSLPLTSRKDGN